MNVPKPIVEERFDYKEFPCVILFQPMGYRTGYVGLNKGHRFYGKDYNDIPIDCHCGLTYSRSYLYGQEDKDVWWIGYDCGHICDSRDIDSVKKYYGAKIADDMNDYFSYLNCAVERDFDYCKKQCEYIVEQLTGEINNGLE